MEKKDKGIKKTTVKVEPNTNFSNINNNIDENVVKKVITPPSPVINKAEAERKLRMEKANLKKQQIQKEKIERERLNARRRVEKARLVEEQKLAKNQQILLTKEKKEKKQIERKNKIAQQERLKKQQAVLTAKLKEEKRLDKSRDSERKSNFGGWLAAVVALGVSVLALGSMLAVTLVKQGDSNNLIEQKYQQSFYDLVNYVDNLDLNLSKLRVTTGESEQQNYLTNVVVQSELAVSSIQELPMENQNKIETSSFINTVGDYSRSLIKKVGSGDTLSQQDRKSIDEIYNVVKELRAELSDLSQKLGHSYRFMTLLAGKDNDQVLNKFNDLENNSVEYPKLIYDGPFSSNLEKVSSKALENLEEISKEQASKKIDEYFSEYKMSKIVYDGETNGKEFATYNYAITLEDGEMLYAQLTKKGGLISMFDMQGDCQSQNFDKDTCVEIAENFLNKVGYKGMKAVWINDSSNIATINFAYEVNDVIVYSDLIKVKVCEEKGSVIGLESRAYLLNHTDSRQINMPISMETARSAVFDKLEILTQRKAIIPKSSGKEITAYEFMGKYDDSVYYVYINAETGKQTEIFKVIESTEGMLLM